MYTSCSEVCLDRRLLKALYTLRCHFTLSFTWSILYNVTPLCRIVRSYFLKNSFMFFIFKLRQWYFFRTFTDPQHKIKQIQSTLVILNFTGPDKNVRVISSSRQPNCDVIGMTTVRLCVRQNVLGRQCIRQFK